jgi:hypothetical protein
MDFLTTLLFLTAEAYFFDQTSFHHAKTDFFDHPSYLPPNPTATGLRTIQFLFKILWPKNNITIKISKRAEGKKKKKKKKKNKKASLDF